MIDHLSKHDLLAVQQFIAESYCAQTPADFSALWTQLGTFIDCEYTACGIVDLRSLNAKVSHSSYTPEFLQAYLGLSLASDPSIQQLLTSSDGIAITYDETQDNQGRIHDIKQQAGITNCCSVAIRGGLGLCMYMAFSNLRRRQHGTLSAIISLVGAPFMLSCMRCTAPWEQQTLDHPKLPLTQREEEVFSWVLQGKTNWEIGHILNIKERTVRFHLESITTKYGQARTQLSPRTRWELMQSQLLVAANDSSN